MKSNQKIIMNNRIEFEDSKTLEITIEISNVDNYEKTKNLLQSMLQEILDKL